MHRPRADRSHARTHAIATTLGALFVGASACSGATELRPSTAPPAPASAAAPQAPASAAPQASAPATRDAGTDAPTDARAATSDGLGLPTAPASMGSFRAAMRIAAAPDGCPATLTDVAVAAPDEAWFVGGCGARVHFVGGRFDALPPQTVKMPVMRGQTCPAYANFLGVLARSPKEVYFTSTSNCGLDPSLVFQRALERWDGGAMRKVPSAYVHATPHDSVPTRLAAGAKGALVCIGSGDDWSGPPKDGIYRLGPVGWGKALRFGLPHDYPLGSPPSDWNDATRMESYAALASTEAGAIWIVGKRKAPAESGGDGSTLSGLVLKLEDGRFAERTLDDTSLVDVSVGSDGSTWIAGKRLWRLVGDGFERVDLGIAGEHAITSVWARSANDVWLVVTKETRAGSIARVAHFDGARAVEVTVEGVEPADEPARVRGNADSVWLVGSTTAYRRALDADRDGGAAPSPVVVDVKPPWE